MTMEGAASRLTLLILLPLTAAVGIVALVVIFLGPVGVGALMPLLGGAGYLASRHTPRHKVRS